MVNNSIVNQEIMPLPLLRVNRPMKISNSIPTLSIISGIANPKLFVIDSSFVVIPVSKAYGFCRDRTACKTESVKCCANGLM